MTSSDQRYVNEGAMNPAPESSWGKLLPLLPEGSLVLEVGCAHGSFSYAMKTHRQCRVVGVEIDPEWAEHAKAQCEEVIVGDITQLIEGPLKERTFDVIVAADVIEHLPHPDEVLRKLSKLLSKGGVLLASIPNVTHFSVLAELAQGRFPRSPEGLLDATHVQFFGEEDVLSLFKSADYAAAIVDRVRIDPPHTEFKTDLTRLPQPLVDFLDQSPNSNTYQFIVRAVPSQWATLKDSQTVPPPSASPVRESLAVALKQAEITMNQLHRQLGKQTEEASKLHEELNKYHQALTKREAQATSQSAEIKALQDKTKKLHQVLETERATRFEEQAPLSRLRVLYVASRESASYRYRVLNACQQLREAGIVANIAQVGTPELLEQIPQYSLIVLFRLDWNVQVQKIVQTARKAGAGLAFDIDDLIFHPGSEKLIPFLSRLTEHEISTYRGQFPALRNTLEQADFTIASTPTIARYVEDLGKTALVHPNLLSRTHINVARAIYTMRPVLQRIPFIGYMSGSNTHDGDFARTTDALVEVLRQRQELSLLLCGPVELPKPLVPFQERVARLQLEDYHTYPWLMARCRALIAPIEVLNDFADSKSALKVFEAGVCGVPVVASPTAPYRQAIRHGVSGFLADTTQEWTRALLTLADANTSLEMGKRAREIALSEYSPDTYRFVLARALARRAGKFTGESPELRPLSLSAPPPRRHLSALKQVQRVVRRSAALAIRRPARIAETTPEPTSSSKFIEARIFDEGNVYAHFLASAAREEGDALILNGERVGTVLVDVESPLRAKGAQHVAAAEGSGPGPAFSAIGTDPAFVLQKKLHTIPKFLVLELRVSASPQPPCAQLFWKTAEGEQFSETNSLRFP
ncbi:MAG: methyltransferase domain-containing protein, partial [Myxococcaceae bacterium]